jgi:hypothetical protein
MMTDHTINQIEYIHALTSGNYQQAEGKLRDRNGKYCCLGVACDVYRTQTGDGEWVDGDSFKLPEGTSGTYLPPHIADWLGIPAEYVGTRDDDGDYDPILVVLQDGDEEEIEVRASVINDNGGTFEAIADLFEYLFVHQKPREMNLDEYRTVIGYQGDISDLV